MEPHHPLQGRYTKYLALTFLTFIHEQYYSLKFQRRSRIHWFLWHHLSCIICIIFLTAKIHYFFDSVTDSLFVSYASTSTVSYSCSSLLLCSVRAAAAAGAHASHHANVQNLCQRYFISVVVDTAVRSEQFENMELWTENADHIVKLYLETTDLISLVTWRENK